MTARIDSIYCFDYTEEGGHYDSIRNFASEEMTYIGLSLSTPTVSVDANPVSFDISSIGSNQIREYAVSQFAGLNEISKDLAVNSPKYILFRYVDGSERYFTYNEQFFTMFKIALQYNSKEKPIVTNVSPYTIQKNAPTDTIRYTRPQQPPIQTQSYTAQMTHSQRNYTSTAPINKKTGSFQWGKLFLGIVVFFLIIIAIISATADDSDLDAGLTPVAEPKSGTILSGKEVFYGSEITIRAASGESCVVKLKNRYGTERISFYVRAGDTVTVGVPAEYLYVYFATGDTWYGKTDLFGSKTSYSMDDEIFDFTKYTCEYTLYPVSNGNFSETPIDEDEFK